MVKLKRAHELAAGDGERVLVERPWPRGVHKTDLRLLGSRTSRPAPIGRPLRNRS